MLKYSKTKCKIKKINLIQNLNPRLNLNNHYTKNAIIIEISQKCLICLEVAQAQMY